MRIAAVETTRYRFPFDPPLRAAWDPVPRTHQDATLVCVVADDGSRGYASGDALPDAELLGRLLAGVDPFRTEAVREVCETADFHGGRPWTLEVAVWDLVGRALGQPLWRLLGGRSESLVAYATKLGPKKILLVHGDPPAVEWMRAQVSVQLPSSDVVVPTPGVTYEL